MAAQEASQALRWRYGDVDDGNFSVRGGRGVPLLATLFAVLVFFVGVCVYLRWVCRRYNTDATLPSSFSYPSSSPSSSAAAPGAPSAVAGLDAAAIAGLPVTPYSRPPSASPGREDDETQCPICLGEFADGERVKALPRCGHCFHPECVDAWLCSHPSCPLCRGSLLADTSTVKIVDASEAV
ncbi:RING-H2 finger protein ATL66 [Aegilops tauschii subsp. strangulata]|uniref:RING-type E3 ubiquitin transferase n=2 Tax=Triticinae TaxID=1648030 RepID=A0A453FUV7_AEGTS|nr:RING-H2 finger protein ATL66 [Aegilops tauschii subsp. strangulata]XP_044353601.1 RING-H2 finger protein ATL66-like [Triticum aestivum]